MNYLINFCDWIILDSRIINYWDLISSIMYNKNRTIDCLIILNNRVFYHKHTLVFNWSYASNNCKIILNYTLLKFDIAFKMSKEYSSNKAKIINESAVSKLHVYSPIISEYNSASRSRIIFLKYCILNLKMWIRRNLKYWCNQGCIICKCAIFYLNS